MAWHPFRHLGLKVTALALGTLLWLTVSGHQIERRVAVPVSYSNVPSDLEIAGGRVDNANVRVRGTDSTVSTLGQGHLRVNVDLRNAHPGVNLIALRIEEVVAPLGIEVLQVEPPMVNLTLERSGQREVRVEPMLEGEPAAGYAVRGVTVEPATVMVFGPESRLQSEISVITDPVSLRGRTATVSQEVRVGLTDEQLRLGDALPVRVVVRIERTER